MIDSDMDDLRETLRKIEQWIEAYPVDVFPEPDLWEAHEVLKAAGISLGAISASNYRHVLNGIKRIIAEGTNNAS